MITVSRPVQTSRKVRLRIFSLLLLGLLPVLIVRSFHQKSEPLAGPQSGETNADSEWRAGAKCEESSSTYFAAAARASAGADRAVVSCSSKSEQFALSFWLFRGMR
jgi:hypothetical protein